MAFTLEMRRKIYDRTDGYCHLCHAKLSFLNYASADSRGAWEVEHSRAKARGGTDHGNNLYPACIQCNRGKSHSTARSVRKTNGVKRAPYSKTAKQRMRDGNTIAYCTVGGLLGIVAGPVGVIAGASLGAAFGRSLKLPKS